MAAVTRRSRSWPAAVLALAGILAPCVHAQPTLENKLKAAVVSKFPQFVEWPPAALDGRTTVDLCVAPPDPFGGDLEELVADQTLGDRRLAVRRVEREGDIAGCHMFVVVGATASRLPLLRRAIALPILTVGDDPRFMDEGGIVRLRVVDGRIRFDINADAARRAGLRISSQLLQLALTVKGSQG